MNKRIAVVGAGAIGAAIGAYLIKAGHDITLIDQWAAHIEKIRSDGLKLTDQNGESTVPAKALHLSDVSNLSEQFDIVYLSVKSYDTQWSTYLIEPFLKPMGFILPAQNALNDELVASIVGFSRTVGCVPHIGSAVYEPGPVIRTDPTTSRSFTIGELSGLITPRLLEIADNLKVTGPSELTTNILGERWAKLVVNCMRNTIAGLIGPALSSLTEAQKDTTDLIRAATGCEVVRVGLALGVTIEPVWGIPAQELAETTTRNSLETLKDKLEAHARQIEATPDQAQKVGAPSRPSLLQDVIKGRRTEVDYLNGHVVKKGEKLGIATPMNRAITDLMKKLEKGEIKPGPSYLPQLTAHLAF